MEVILMERIEKLGQMGDVVSVKPGYARNYLLPQKKALRATKGNMARFEQERVHLEADNLKRREEAERVVKDLEGLTVTLVRQAGEGGQLYGSVNGRDIADAVSEAGITIDRKQVALIAVIKTLGLHSVRVQLHPEVSVDITANVARSEEEAETQMKSGRVVTAEDLRQAEEAAEAEVEAVVESIEQEEETAQSSESESADDTQPSDATAEETPEENKEA